jgi:hypothetical protein
MVMPETKPFTRRLSAGIRVTARATGPRVARTTGERASASRSIVALARTVERPTGRRSAW